MCQEPTRAPQQPALSSGDLVSAAVTAQSVRATPSESMGAIE
jgi:hypothetical protein